MKSLITDSRIQFEKGIISQDLLAELYLRYNRIENIELFLGRAKGLFPKLNCGIASLYLQYKLGTGEIVKGKYGQHNHTFLRVGSVVVDITADQFGGPKVYYGPLVEPWTVRSLHY